MSPLEKTEKEFIGRVEKHQGIIHKICLVYGKDDANKEDLYQEIILQLWKSYSSFKGRSKFSTWMFRVSLNTALTYTKNPRFFVEFPERQQAKVDFEASMDYSEDVKTLYRAIQHLNKIEKAIILMWLDEKNYEEISETIGITVKNVSVKLVRIKKKLAEIISKLQ